MSEEFISKQEHDADIEQLTLAIQDTIMQGDNVSPVSSPSPLLDEQLCTSSSVLPSTQAKTQTLLTYSLTASLTKSSP